MSDNVLSTGWVAVFLTDDHKIKDVSFGHTREGVLAEFPTADLYLEIEVYEEDV
jgi:hypothetical protein